MSAEFAAFGPARARSSASSAPPAPAAPPSWPPSPPAAADGAAPAPTLWLRGADLLADDTSVADAARPYAGPRGPDRHPPAGARRRHGDGHRGADRPSRRATPAAPCSWSWTAPRRCRPLLAHRLAEWTAATARWLREHGVRLVVACRPEYWEQAGALTRPAPCTAPARPARAAAARALRLGDLTADEADAGPGAPTASRRTPSPRPTPGTRSPCGCSPRSGRPCRPASRGRPGRDEVFAAHLDLMCLRIAVRIAAAADEQPARHRRTPARRPGRRARSTRRPAAAWAPGRESWTGSRSRRCSPGAPAGPPAVSTEGLLVPAGAGYRFAHEELADWIQGAHLDLDAALHALVHRGTGGARLPSAHRGQPRSRPCPATASAPSSRPCCSSAAARAPPRSRTGWPT